MEEPSLRLKDNYSYLETKMAATLLMPKATAIWLIDNTALTFDQVADFCSLHILEIQSIADGDVAGGVRGVNPINNGQLTKEEIAKAEADENYRMKLLESKVKLATKKRKGPRYTPISRRNERPGAIKWLVRSHPELKDAAIIRLVGTTKTTIEAVREGTHWNSANLSMLDPVTLGLCTQIDLDMEVKKAAGTNPDSEDNQRSTKLLSAQDALAKAHDGIEAPASIDNLDDAKKLASEEEIDADSVFANLTSLKKD